MQCRDLIVEGLAALIETPETLGDDAAQQLQRQCAAILDLVPADGRLVVEARLDPGDRDSVAPGQTARLRFLAFNQRLIDRVEGRVLSISADRLLDDRSGLPFYRALIEITGDVARALGGAEIYPGMQVQTMIVTGERSALGYLLRPILQNIERAMLED